MIELLDSGDEEEAAAVAAASCSLVEIDNYVDEHWDVLFGLTRKVKTEASADGEAVKVCAPEVPAGPKEEEQEVGQLASRVKAES